MHIKRFVARDMKHAIRLVRDEQGPEAVILSNQRVPGGIEIIAAVDYDPRLINDALIANAPSASPSQLGAVPPPRSRLRPTLPAPPSRSGREEAQGAGAPAAEAEDTAALIAALRARAAQSQPTARAAGPALRCDGPDERHGSDGAPAAAAASPVAAAAATAATNGRSRGSEAAADARGAGRRFSLADMPRDGILIRPPAAADDAGRASAGPEGGSPAGAPGPQAAAAAQGSAGDRATPAGAGEAAPAGAGEQAPDDGGGLDAFGLEATGALWTGALPAEAAPAPAREVRYSEIPDEPVPGAAQTRREAARAHCGEADADSGTAPGPARDPSVDDGLDLEDDDLALSPQAQQPAAARPAGQRGGFLSVLAGVTRLGGRRGGAAERRGEPARTPAADQVPERPLAAAGGDAAPPRRQARLIIRSLTKVGVTEPLARQLTEAVARGTAAPLALPDVIDQASARLRTLEREIVDTGGVVALVGPTGVGKTTSVAKLAARFALKHGRDRLALLTTDTFRVGAHEQLNTFAGILGVPLHTAEDAKSLGNRLRELSKHRLVLIDTAGMSQRDMRLAEELALLSRSRADIRVLLTLSANTERRTMLDAIERFSSVDPIGCVLTKIDEAVAPGTALSALIETGLPLAYTSDGQNVPEDLYWAAGKRRSLVRRAFQQADMEGHQGDDIDADEVRDSA